jgi:DNA polymerase III subunit delta
MTALKAHEVARYLLRPDLSEGIFLAYGPDAGLVRETGQALVRHFSGNEAISLVTLDANDADTDTARLETEAKSASLFGEKRVVRVRNASKALVMGLTDLKDDPGGAAIILEAGNLLPKDALRALVETAKFGRALPCYPDTDETLTALIRETLGKAGIAADGDTIAVMRSSFGNDREITRRELDKLVLYAEKSKRLTREDVLVLCADNSALLIDDVIDAAGTGHAQNAETTLNKALNSGTEPQKILVMTAMHFAGLRRLRAEVSSGKPVRSVIDGMRPKPHFSRRAALEQQLRLWTDSALADVCERLHAATAESRWKPALSESLVRRTILAIAMSAAER